MRPYFLQARREVQNLFEANFECLLGVRFVASEFSTNQGGRIDTLGIDEIGFPVVIEYKLDKNRTVINQGMSYMAWLSSHKAEFWKIAFQKLGQEAADKIDHSSIRLICIATDFTRDDLGAYELPSNIKLVRYRRFGDSHLILERVQSADAIPLQSPTGPKPPGGSGTDKAFAQVLEDASPESKELYESLRQAILEQSEDLTEKITKLYAALKRTRNFASIVNGKKGEWLLQLHLNPDEVQLKENWRDVRNIGIWGTGQLQIRVNNQQQIGEALTLIKRAYEGQS